MANPIIEIDNVGKQYQIGLHDEFRRSLRETIMLAASAPWRRFRRLAGHTTEASEFWALRDVSFDVHAGEVVGIIGANGAGKSTLLKVLSQITEPTTGRIELRGRIASLLEVGTGFHPELTGRENVFLNGAILGMTRSEIARKFDDIIAFADLGRFVDTPVKRYSSGMYVRLAFAVAAHLEPEILVIDEVLAVGDVAFQKKCLGKMNDIATGGRTVLFVSHQMPMIRHLCSRAIHLDQGRVANQGPVDSVISHYLQDSLPEGQVDVARLPVRSDSYGVSLEEVEVRLENQADHIDLVVETVVNARRPMTLMGIGLRIETPDGVKVVDMKGLMSKSLLTDFQGTRHSRIVCPEIDRYLGGGQYVIDLRLEKPGVETIFDVDRIAKFDLPAKDIYGCGEAFESRRSGLVPLPVRFEALDPSQV